MTFPKKQTYPLSYFIICCLVLLCQNLNGQILNDSISFQSINKELFQGKISQIFEDSYGFIWLATPKGLYKFDGSNFELFEKNVNPEEGLINNFIVDIFESKDKKLYIGTYEGLNIYDRELNSVRPYKFKGEGASIQTRNIMSIDIIDDYMLLGTNHNGLYKYNYVSGKTTHLKFEASRNSIYNYNYIIKTAKLDKNSHLVITQASIYIIDSDLNILKEFNHGDNINHALKIDKHNYLLGSQYGDLYFLEVDKNHEIKLSKKHISEGYALVSLAQQANENIWVGSENDGLYIYNKAKDELKNYRANPQNENSFASNSISSLLKAKNNVMWIGQFKQSLHFYDPNYHKFNLIKSNPLNTNSLSNDIVTCFLEDEKGNLFIGTDGGGLNYWNRSKQKFEHFSLNNRTLNTDVVLSLLEDNKKQLWVGSWADGLAIFEPNRKSYKVLNTKNSFLKSDNISHLLQDKKGRIWIVAQYGGLHLYYPETGAHKNIEIHLTDNDKAITNASRVAEDKDGNIWIGTETLGIIKLTENSKDSTWMSKQYHSTNKKNTLSNDFVNSILVNKDGKIWVGTESGLNQYQPESDTFIPITKKDGFINDAIKGIIQDKNNNLWLSTAKGIVQYNPIETSFLNFDMADGLQGNEYNTNAQFKTKKGEFLFGGVNGFNIFKPDEIKQRLDTTKVHIQALKVFNSPIYPNDETKILSKHISQLDSLTLSYSDAVFSLDYNTLTFRHPKEVEYAYFLEGFETEWNYVGKQKSATYTNLNAGTYTFKVKSTNSDGVWNDDPTSLHIKVVPPFWKTTWFTVLLFIITALLIYLFHYLKVRNFKKNQVLLEERIKERTKELVEQKNKLMEVADELSSKNEEIQRFAFAVSHDLKSPLSSIKGIASIIPMEFVLKDFPDMENYLDMINISCDTMSDLIADITKIAKLGKIENKKEMLDTNEIMKLAKTLVSGKLNVQNVDLSIAPSLPSIFGDRNRMIQVFGNLIDNAVKYMGDQKQPKISITAREDENIIQLLVKDNGSGMDNNALKKLFSPFERFHENTKGTGLGLYMIKQIVESHNGKITVNSAGLGEGATFIVSLPLTN